jgi:predicted O-methyltransferase YrrM
MRRSKQQQEMYDEARRAWAAGDLRAIVDMLIEATAVRVTKRSEEAKDDTV